MTKKHLNESTSEEKNSDENSLNFFGWYDWYHIFEFDNTDTENKRIVADKNLTPFDDFFILSFYTNNNENIGNKKVKLNPKFNEYFAKFLSELNRYKKSYKSKINSRSIKEIEIEILWGWDIDYWIYNMLKEN